MKSPRFESEDIDMTPADERSLRLSHEYSDDELLRELRRRGRLARVEAHSVAPWYAVRDGYSLAEQTSRTCDIVGHELAEAICGGQDLPGYKVEMGGFMDQYNPPDRPDRRQTVVLNYVVEKPK